MLVFIACEKVALIGSSLQAMIRVHNGFERNLGAVREQVEILNKEAQRLVSLFPDVKEHINEKNLTVTDLWHALLMKSARKRHRYVFALSSKRNTPSSLHALVCKGSSKRKRGKRIIMNTRN